MKKPTLDGHLVLGDLDLDEWIAQTMAAIAATQKDAPSYAWRTKASKARVVSKHVAKPEGDDDVGAVVEDDDDGGDDVPAFDGVRRRDGWAWTGGR